MRISTEQAESIKKIVAEALGDDAKVWLFGSRADDNARGGDVDLLVLSTEEIENPSSCGAHIAARVMRVFWGRKTDVIIEAPNIKHKTIHDIAKETGVLL